MAWPKVLRPHFPIFLPYTAQAEVPASSPWGLMVPIRVPGTAPSQARPDGSRATHIYEPLLVLLSHLGQPVVAACQVPFEALQGRDGHVLHLPSLSPAAGRWQAQPTDAAACAHPRGQHVTLIKLPMGDLPKQREHGVTTASCQLQSHHHPWGPPPLTFSTPCRASSDPVHNILDTCWNYGGRGTVAKGHSYFMQRHPEYFTALGVAWKKSNCFRKDRFCLANTTLSALIKENKDFGTFLTFSLPLQGVCCARAITELAEGIWPRGSRPPLRCSSLQALECQLHGKAEGSAAYLGCVQIRGVLHHPGVIAIVP